MSMKPKLSIVISSYNRLALLRRTLWSIATRPPSVPFEVIVVDDGSTEDTLREVQNYASRFFYKFIRFDSDKFEKETGLKKQWGNPAVTNNIGWKHAQGDVICQQGNEVIAYADVYDRLLADRPVKTGNYLVVSTTYDLGPQYLDRLDQYGSNLLPKYVEESKQQPLQSIHYRSDVTNYISIASRNLWETLQGYDERYMQGISAEDSDFVRRARALPPEYNFQFVVSDGISLHQFHSGKTRYYDPPPSVITKERWDELVEVNHVIYRNWDGTHKNPQKWSPGTIGVGEIITNYDPELKL